MSEIKINYKEVYQKAAIFSNIINNDTKEFININYNKINSMLNLLDSATNAKLIEVSDNHRTKSIECLEVLEKLLSFMSNSAMQIQVQEAKMAQRIKINK